MTLPYLSDVLLATNRTNKEVTVYVAKKNPLLCMPKKTLKSGANIITHPFENDNSNMMIAGLMAVLSKISCFCIFKIAIENFCGIASVSFTLYKIITEPIASAAET